MSYMTSETTTVYGTQVQRYLDLDGNFPVVRRKYIPSDGSNFQKAGIESITKFTSPSPSYNNKYYVVRNNGQRNSYTIQELRNLFKELNIPNIVGHKAKDGLSKMQKYVIKMIKQGK